jgi:hypothetical protein
MKALSIEKIKMIRKKSKHKIKADYRKTAYKKKNKLKTNRNFENHLNRHRD